METAQLLGQGMLQMVKFGPFLNFRVTVNSVSALPKGLVAAGAACSVTTVDADDALGQAKVTVVLVRLGYVNFVRDIVVYLVDKLDRSDVVAAITAGLLQLKELEVVTEINNALVAEGHVQVGAKIAGSMVSQGHTEMAEIASAATVQSAGDSGVVKDIKKAGANVLSAFGEKTDTGKDSKGAGPHSKDGDTSKQAAHDVTKQEGSLLGGIKDAANQLASKAQQYVPDSESSRTPAAH